MKTDSAGATKGLGMRSSLRVGIFTVVGTAFVLYGPAVLADNSPINDHQIEQPGPIYLGTTGSNIDDFGEVIIDGEIVDVCFTGTLGALVEDEGGALYILGNNHVLARTNQGSLGEAIIQPGLGDQNSVCDQNTADTVANLTEFVTIKFGALAGPFFRFKSNTVDAAIAQIVLGAVDTSGEILDVGVPDPNPAAATPGTPGTPVTKSGRTTGQTSGNVAAVDVEVFVCYADPCNDVTNIARFVSQIRIDGNFSLPGDSGSLIVSADLEHHPVALLFAGGTNTTFANPIDLVLSSLNVAMAGCSSDPTCSGEEEGGGGGPGGGGGGGGGGGPGGGGPPGQNSDISVPAGLEIASQVKARHAEELFAIRGVVGTGISVDDAGRPVIEVYVESAARDAEHPIPTELEGIPVRVVVTGKIIAY